MVIEMDEREDWKKHLSQQDLREVLAERNACFVLITCGAPNEEGKMEVEMIHEGDPPLVAYLIESAHSLIENQHEQT
jgi:hypothetical protein